jgi:hypothetical protein
LGVRGRKLPKDGRLALAQYAAKDFPSPALRRSKAKADGGEGRGDGGRGNKHIVARSEQLELHKAVQEFEGMEGHGVNAKW